VIAINVGEIPLDAAFIQALLTKVREKFEPVTPITMSFRKCHFSSGTTSRTLPASWLWSVSNRCLAG
jgi:hypothetical protein